MACPVTGASLSEKRSNPHSFDTVQESTDSLKKIKHEYGLDTNNFNHDFLQPDFNCEDMKKIVNESIILAAGPVAILLQMAAPGVSAGVNRHSNFAYRVQDRLRTTMTFVYCMAYGTPEEKKTIINMVHSAHAPIRGEDYAADDADLQLWVAATLYATGLDIYERVFGKFDNATADRIYDQYSVMATSLRVPPEMWPKTRADFWTYWDKQVKTLPITEDAVQVKNDLLFNKQLPWWVKLMMPGLRVTTAEWLPETMREPYGFKKNSRWRKFQYNMINAMVQSTYPHLPKRVRGGLVSFYMKDMRTRMASNGHVIGREGEPKMVKAAA